MITKYFKGDRTQSIRIGNTYFNDQGKEAEVVGQWGDYYLVVHYMGNLRKSPLNLHKTVNRSNGICLAGGSGYDLYDRDWRYVDA
jgi:hypothetical protein